jgi:hypothetical protein
VPNLGPTRCRRKLAAQGSKAKRVVAQTFSLSKSFERHDQWEYRRVLPDATLVVRERIATNSPTTLLLNDEA